MEDISVINSTLWHTKEVADAMKVLGTSANGLSGDEAKKRLATFGENRIKRSNKDGWATVLWRQINNPLIWVLISSGSIAAAIGKLTDGIVVLSVVVVNTIIGFIQEYKAGKAIEALIDMVPQNATVMRNGLVVTIPVADLVPGDIVQLAAGDRVPADMRLVASKNLQVEEAALTGESVPAQKHIQVVEEKAVLGDRICMVYGGTLVTSGTATAIVTGTGVNTELGRISNMLNETTDLETPLTKKLGVIGNYITIGVIAITVVILIAGTMRALGQGVAMGVALKDTLIFAIALAVGAIPEGLPAVVTIALAIGVQRMAKRKAIIRKLPAVETLGSTTIICSDKTGTLTRNEMTVTELWTPLRWFHVSGTGYNRDGEFTENSKAVAAVDADMHHLLLNAVLCNDSGVVEHGEKMEITGDPTEVALLVAALKANLSIENSLQQYPRIDSIPFDSENQFMATLNKLEGNVIIMKGAPEVVLGKCSGNLSKTPFDKEKILSEMMRMGNNGMRVLAVAEKNCATPAQNEIHLSDAEEGFSFVGLIGMIDPPRKEAIDAIKSCHNAGITVKMITGDHPATASAIGIALGLDAKGIAISGKALSAMSNDEIRHSSANSNIFARVAPEHKLRLVRGLQEQNHIVAMTGDGVNDAPSLKQSNIGVAMGITGTSVSKEAADIILADDNFASISAAVEEGRRVYDNLIKSLAFLLPTNLGLAFILIWGIMFFPFNPLTKMLLLPMLPTQLLWINLVAAVALALPLAFEAKEPNIMSRPPRNPNEPLFSQFVVFRLFFVSLLMTAGTIILFNWQHASLLLQGINADLAMAKAQTISVTFVIFFQIFYLLNCRSLKDSIMKIGLTSNPFIFVGIGTVLLLQAIFIYAPFMQKVFGTTPLDGKELLITLVVGFLVFPIIAVEKFVVRRMSLSKKR